MVDKFYESCTSCDAARMWKTNVKSVFLINMRSLLMLICFYVSGRNFFFCPLNCGRQILRNMRSVQGKKISQIY